MHKKLYQSPQRISFGGIAAGPGGVSSGLRRSAGTWLVTLDAAGLRPSRGTRRSSSTGRESRSSTGRKRPHTSHRSAGSARRGPHPPSPRDASGHRWSLMRGLSRLRPRASAHRLRLPARPRTHAAGLQRLFRSFPQRTPPAPPSTPTAWSMTVLPLRGETSRDTSRQQRTEEMRSPAWFTAPRAGLRLRLSAAAQSQLRHAAPKRRSVPGHQSPPRARGAPVHRGPTQGGTTMGAWAHA